MRRTTKVSSPKKRPAEKPDQTKRSAGRPSSFTQAVADEICRRLYESEGGELPESLRAICRDPKMPGLSTVMDWLKSKEGFSEQYAHARRLRMDALVERLHHLMSRLLPEAKAGVADGISNTRVQAVKIEIDALKWIISKEYPREYGDKISQEISGPNGGPIESRGVDLTPEKQAQLNSWIDKLDGGLKPPGK